MLDRVKRVVPRIMPHVTAAFVVFFVAGALADVIPDVTLGMNRKTWREPRVRDELTRWSDRLGMKREDLEDDLFSLGQLMLHARGAVNAPFRPFQKLTGVRQSWAMFVAGTRYRDRFQVRARACGLADPTCDWEVLYQNADDDHVWHRELFEHARVRSAIFRWGWPQLVKTYERGCKAIARLAFQERADLVVVQCRFERSRSPPGPPDAEWGREQTVPR